MYIVYIFLILRYFEFWNDWIYPFYKGNSLKPFIEWCWDSQIASHSCILSLDSTKCHLFSLILSDNSLGDHWVRFPTVITWPGSSLRDLEQPMWLFPAPERTVTNFFIFCSLVVILQRFDSENPYWRAVMFPAWAVTVQGGTLADGMLAAATGLQPLVLRVQGRLSFTY